MLLSNCRLPWWELLGIIIDWNDVGMNIWQLFVALAIII